MNHVNHTFQTDQFEFTYTESHIENSFSWERHCHARYEMIAVLEGDVRIMLEGRTYRLTENQVGIIPPLLYHTVMANKREAYRRVTALFSRTAVPAALREQFEEKTADPTIFFWRQLHEFRTICEAESPSFYEPLANSLMTQIFYHIIRAEQADKRGDTDEFLQKIILYIDRHLGEKILLDDLAAYTARSKSSVCHLFEEKMGISPRQYILQKRLALANKLIRDGTPPTLAAIQVGYENYSAFYRVYRKHFQTNPSNG